MALALKAGDLAKALAECGVAHAGAVNSYAEARRAALDWNAGSEFR